MLGFFTNRVNVIAQHLVERVRHGTVELVGKVDREVLFILDGVGGFQIAPLIIRRVFRNQATPPATVLYNWQFGLVGEIWSDLMWLRRNRVMGARLARKMLAFRRDHPTTTIHLAAFSGGAGIAVFACEQLRRRRIVGTLALLCPALSPGYNLAPALHAVERCYALISRRDRLILGLGTTLFGTTDRRFTSAAGLAGFRLPPDLSAQDNAAYQRLREIYWSPDLRNLGHPGGHTGWVSPQFLGRHLIPILRGEPLLPVHEVAHR